MKSLIKVVSLCKYMLVPTEEMRLKGAGVLFPEEIPGYGSRSWWCVMSHLVRVRVRVRAEIRVRG